MERHLRARAPAHVHACSSVCTWRSDEKDVQLRGGRGGSRAARRLACSPSFFLPLCSTQNVQTSFCCCRCSQVLADALESESFKQPHLHTQLTHSIDFVVHHIFFCPPPSQPPSALFVFSKCAVQLGGHCLKPSEALLGAAWPG